MIRIEAWIPRPYGLQDVPRATLVSAEIRRCGTPDERRYRITAKGKHREFLVDEDATKNELLATALAELDLL